MAYLMTACEFVAKAKEIEKTTTAYMWGTYGRPITQSLIDAKKVQYPNRYSTSYMNKLKTLIGKGFGWDCCGLIKGILWGWDGVKNVPYSVNGVPDTNVMGFFNKGLNKSTNWKDIPIGAILHKPTHMGIYIGDGLAIEATSAWQSKVMTTYVSNIGVKSGYYGHAWDSFYLLEWINYGDQTIISPTSPKPEPSKLEKWMTTNQLKPGSQGKIVEAVQAFLMAKDYDVREIDGDFGSVTTNAVKQFQKDRNQVSDGWIGPITWTEIFKNSNSSTSSKFKEYRVIVTTPNGLNVRKEPTTSSNKVTLLKTGTTTLITDEKGEWGFASEYNGWIHLGYTKKT